MKHEYRLSWIGGQGTGETVSVASDSVSPDRFHPEWAATMDELFVPARPEDGEDTDATKMTREQFRTAVKALTDSGHFETVVPREVTPVEFNASRAWADRP